MARRSKENAVDWDAIERQFRLGKKSNKQLGDEFGVADSNIGRRAKKFGWVVDKSEEVDAVTNALLIQNASGNANPNATPTALEIKAVGQASADVVLGHRDGLQRLRKVGSAMLEELEVATSLEGRALISELAEVMDPQRVEDGEAMSQEEEAKHAARMKRLLDKVLDAPARVETLKKLVEIDEKIRKGEREAFGIDNSKGGEGGYEELLAKLGRGL